jgi:hypothetical protein
VLHRAPYEEVDIPEADVTYRDEFLDELTTDMRETFRARAEYLRLCGEAAPAG